MVVKNFFGADLEIPQLFGIYASDHQAHFDHERENGQQIDNV